MFDFIDEEFISAFAARVALPLMVVGAVTVPWVAIDKGEDLLDGEKDITISISDEMNAQLKKGEGNPARLYEEFGKQVNDIIVNNGGCVTVTIDVEGDGKEPYTFSNEPARTSMTERSADLCP
jgi:hypothetical protein